MTREVKAGRYEIEQEIGRGGMGVVYRARDTRLGRSVALKMLPPEVTHDTALRKRLATEARAASALSHPGVATVYDFIEEGDEAFIVFEYVEGITLREQLNRGRRSTEQVLDLGIQVADALAAAHERGVVHRDLKPENIMLVAGIHSGSRAKILDFGLAKIRQPLQAAGSGIATSAETAAVATAPGLIVGTVNYMSPEQVEGEPADARADIFALGLVLYEMASGLNPFVGKAGTSTIANILKQEPPPLAARNPVAPAELDRILRKCLRKRREERYQSSRELLVDLSNLRRDLASPSAASSAAPGFAYDVRRGSMAFARGPARAVLAAIQVGYLTMYGATLVKLDSVVEAVSAFFGARPQAVSSTAGSAVLLIVAGALIGIAVRLYLLSAVSADYPDLGRKFRWLFPPLFVLDVGWAASPLLLHEKLGAGVVLACIACLVYLPFVQRRLVFDAYLATGGRTSAIRPRAEG